MSNHDPYSDWFAVGSTEKLRDAAIFPKICSDFL